MKNVDFSKPGISFVTGFPMTKNTGLLILSIDELFHEKEPHSILVVKNHNAASGILVPSNCCDVTLVQYEGNVHGYFLGEDGAMWYYNGSSIESIEPITSAFGKSTEMFRSHAYTNREEQFAVGGGNTVYFKEFQSKWNSIEIDMKSEIEQHKYVGFEKVLSSRDGFVYLFGWHGIGYIFSHDSAKRMELPVSIDIYDAVLADDGYVYACGDRGTVIMGRGVDNWKVVNNEITDDKLWGISTFKGRVFVCSMDFIYEIVESELQQIEYSELSVIPSFTYKLKSCSECVWSIGSKQLVEFDGFDWRKLLLLK